MEDSLSFMQDDSKLSRSFPIALETSHKSLLKTLIQNNYILAVPPDNQVDDFDKIQEHRLVEHILIKSSFSQGRFMNLNGKHYKINLKENKLKRLCKGITSVEANIISERVKESCYGAYHCIFLDSVLDEVHIEVGPRKSVFSVTDANSLKMYYSANQRQLLHQFFEQAIQKLAMTEVREQQSEGASFNMQQLVQNIAHTTLMKAHDILTEVIADCALIKLKEKYFMDYLRSKTKSKWESAVNLLEEVRALGDDDMRRMMLSNIIECFVHSSIGEYLQSETIKHYSDEQEVLEKQIERYKKRPTELDIPAVFNTCGLKQSINIFEHLRFPQYPFEMLKLLRQAIDRALIELHQFGIERQLPESTLKQTKIDGENIQYLLAILILKSKNPAEQKICACSVYMREFTYFPNSLDQSAYLAAQLEGAIKLISEGKEDKFQTSLDNQIGFGSTIVQPVSYSASVVTPTRVTSTKPQERAPSYRSIRETSTPSATSYSSTFLTPARVEVASKKTPVPVKPVTATRTQPDSDSDDDGLNFE